MPFLLEPDYPTDLPVVETNRERLIKKWGGVKGWEVQKSRHDLKGRGQAVGIPHFNLDRKASNTKMSHRLILHLTKLYGHEVSESVYGRVSKYHFVDGHALNDVVGISKVAADALVNELKVGGEEEEEAIKDGLVKYLETKGGLREIEKTYDLVHSMGINSIPNFLINGSHIIRGAASSSDFKLVFDEVIREGKEGEFVFKESLGL